MKIEALPVPKSTTAGLIFEWEIKTKPTERIKIGRPSHDQYGTFTIETENEGTRSFGLPLYRGELDKIVDYEMLRDILESGEIEENIYNKLKDVSKKTTRIIGHTQGA